MRSSHNRSQRIEVALWGHGCIVLAISILAALISFPTGW
jgi:hypothetical protein